MGNYVFTTSVLVDAVTRDAQDADSKHDMGGNIVPMLVGRGEAAVYDFRDNDVPGQRDRDRGYWRDVGTLDTYYDAHMDLISVDPVFNLYNPEWPIFTDTAPLPPAKFVHGWHGRSARRSSRCVRPARWCRARRWPLSAVAGRACALVGPGGRLGAHGRRRHRPPTPSCATRSSTRTW